MHHLQKILAAALAPQARRPLEQRVARESRQGMLTGMRQMPEFVVLDRPIHEPILPSLVIARQLVLHDDAIDERIVLKDDASRGISQHLDVITGRLEGSTDRCGDQVIPGLMPPKRATPAYLALENMRHLLPAAGLIPLPPIIQSP